MNDIAKLPRWAKHEIEKLRSDILSLESQLAKAIGVEPTRVMVNPYSSMMGREHQCYLQERETIRFAFGKRYLDVRLMGDTVEVMGDSAISIHPRAANVVWIAATDD
jgi:hypothetical protein